MKELMLRTQNRISRFLLIYEKPLELAPWIIEELRMKSPHLTRRYPTELMSKSMETFNPSFTLTLSFHGGFEKTSFELGVFILNNEV